MAVLVLADHDGAHLRETTAKTVTAALKISGEVDVAVLGGAKAVAEAASKIAGLRKVRHAESDALAHGLAEAEEAALLPIAGEYEAILAPATSAGKNVIPRLAARLDVAPLNDVAAVIDAKTFQRPIYAGNAVETVTTADAKVLATIRPTVFEAAGQGGSAPVEALAPGAAPAFARFVSQDTVASGRPELGAAKIVVSGGRALGSEEEFKAVLEPLADRLGAAIGASRAAVDAGYAPNDYQVGQTGKVVAPDLYIAIGISGAIQHLAGIKDARVIVAINTDPDAPIFGVADYGLVGDYKALVPELLAELAKVGR
ncbi:MAG TPA: electron transfer flavoprotein subunit alpha/FixB family protein [Caulobacteraceae bacterium]|nr:electron transfer flavoprotein subunit alpha/FixB family protein [Caulobacteraceae bacterium]